MCKKPELPATIVAAKEKFEVALRDASAIDIVNNFGAAFNAAQVIIYAFDEHKSRLPHRPRRQTR